MDAHSLRIIDVFAEGMRQDVQLEPQRQHGPILHLVLLEERRLGTHIQNIVDTKYVEGFEVDALLFFLLFLLLHLHCLGILLFLLLLIAFFFLSSLLRCRCLFGLLGSFCSGLLCHNRLVLSQLALPGFNCHLPLGPLLVEPCRGLQVLDAHAKFPLQDPLLHVFIALGSLGPLILDVVKAFILGREGELGERGAHHHWRQILGVPLDERHFFLLRGQLSLRRLLLLFLLLRLFLFLLFILLFLVLLFQLLTLLFRGFLLGLTLLLFLFLLGLLFELLHLFLFLFNNFLPLLLQLFRVELFIGSLLFLLQYQFLAVLFELHRRLADNHTSNLLEGRRSESV
mmetsp:Transcript_91566/g.237279  ORF Transcript_91566/g.237279 Transcript_91566/m.237279 type:complete len:341 (+) Transcript_91566:755-1777(+)